MTEKDTAIPAKRWQRAVTVNFKVVMMIWIHFFTISDPKSLLTEEDLIHK